jgi:hypothetical protein
MVIEKLDPIDFEPLVVQLTARKETNLVASEVERYLNEWLSNREENPICQNGCRRKFLNVRQMDNETIQVLIQWLCDQCMDVLFANLADRFPNIEKIRLGSPAIASKESGSKVGSIFFNGRSVTFEDGRTEVVENFEINCEPICVAQIRQFCAETKYLTSAQRLGHLHTYEKNPFVSALSANDCKGAPARFLSYVDAAEYCSWAKVRLPTEGEYFVAATVDDIVHEATAEQVRDLFLSAKIVRFNGLVITSTRIDDLIVCRAGPNVVKRPGWESRIRDNRYLLDKNKPSGQIFTVLIKSL